METLRSFVRTVWQKDEAQRPAGPAGQRMANADGNTYWVKPDKKAGSSELGRVTTPRNKAGIRTDFYEFYWADITRGTTTQHLAGWVRGLLVRPYSSVPSRVRVIWWTLWALAIILATAFLISVLKSWGVHEIACSPQSKNLICVLVNNTLSWFRFIDDHIGVWFKVVIAVPVVVIIVRELASRPGTNEFYNPLSYITPAVVIFFTCAALLLIAEAEAYLFLGSVFIGSLLHRGLVPYLGDVVRYTQPNPENIRQRREVAERGLKLLRDLHDSGKYDRIVIAAHSLGSIVAYDLLRLFWTEYGPNAANAPCAHAEEALADLDQWLADVRRKDSDGWDIEVFRDRQHTIAAALACRACDSPKELPPRKPWLITDFVTLGSPLSHADFLIAKTKDELRTMVRERRMPTCPPLFECDSDKGGAASFRYEDDGQRLPHHASVFSAVRWTNIHDQPNRFFFLFGDLVSGEAGHHFRAHGCDQHRDVSGVKDVKVWIKARRFGLWRSRLLTHTKYWAWENTLGKELLPRHVAVLRNAINLLDQ